MKSEKLSYSSELFYILSSSFKPSYFDQILAEGTILPKTNLF